MLRGGTKQALVLVALCCLVGLQVLAAFGPDHADNHPNHCCPACHIGHSVVLSYLVSLFSAGPDPNHYERLFFDSSRSIPEPLLTAGVSRAPPA